MTHQSENKDNSSALQHILENGLDGLPEAFRIIIDEAMRIERSKALQAQPYERTVERQGYANGFKNKTVATRIGKICFSVPQVRGEVDFYPSALEKGIRSERALKLAIAEMYIQGVSTRKVTHILEQLCGLEITSTQVSNATALLDQELEKWRKRPLINSYQCLILDARYEKVRIDGLVQSCAVLVAIGVDPEGRRSVLGVSAKLSEAEIHWRDFLSILQERGLHGVNYIVSDNHSGLRAALAARFTGVRWQRCQFHFQQNAMAHIPKINMRVEVAQDIRTIFNSPDLQHAQTRLKEVVQKYQSSAPKLASWLETNTPEALTVFCRPDAQRKKLCTTNSLERLNREIKRRTRVVSVFPNEAALERLVSALLSETNDDWQSERPFLSMKN